jgi:hypothetical protein
VAHRRHTATLRVDDHVLSVRWIARSNRKRWSGRNRGWRRHRLNNPLYLTLLVVQVVERELKLLYISETQPRRRIGVSHHRLKFEFCWKSLVRF